MPSAAGDRSAISDEALDPAVTGGDPVAAVTNLQDSRMPPPGPVDGLTSRSILVVEDTYFIADDLVTALKRAGATVVGPAPNRRTALSLLASLPVDAAVLDINLHGESVYPVAESLMERGKPFVFASGYGRITIPDAYRAIALWEKPFDTRRLIASLPALIAGARVEI